VVNRCLHFIIYHLSFTIYHLPFTVYHLPFTVYRLPFTVYNSTGRYYDSINRGREPDVLFVCQERLHIVQSSHLSDAADMVIEIVSPESVGRDRGEKFVEYEAAGVREYWLIDPDRQQAEFYYLADDERYRLLPTADGVFRSQVLPHFWIKVAWLWQEPLPKVLDVARKLELL